MKAYTGEVSKAALVASLERHAAADRIVKGTYWHLGRGCAVGCTLHDWRPGHESDHALYEPLFGIPGSLARLEDRIFEGLPSDKAREWPLRFARAIREGADLSRVMPALLYRVVECRRDALADLVVPAYDPAGPQVRAAIEQVRAAQDQVLAVLATWRDTGVVDEAAAASAKSAAASAKSAAASAWWGRRLGQVRRRLGLVGRRLGRVRRRLGLRRRVRVAGGRADRGIGACGMNGRRVFDDHDVPEDAALEQRIRDDLAMAAMPDASSWRPAVCPTCGGACEARVTGLREVARTGDETAARTERRVAERAAVPWSAIADALRELRARMEGFTHHGDSWEWEEQEAAEEALRAALDARDRLRALSRP